METENYKEEIDNLTQNTTTDLINPVIDAEERRFKNISGMTIQFKFSGSFQCS